MKKLFTLLLLVVLASSCAVTVPEKRYILDYRPFLAQGFVLTPSSSINKTHECLASIWIEVVPKQKTQIIRVSDGSGKTVEKEVDLADRTGESVSDAMEMFVKYARELGANGVIDLQARVQYIMNSRTYIISGVAVHIDK